MKNNFPVLGAITVLLIAVRVLIDGSTQQLLIVACINLVALLLSLVSVLEGIRNGLMKKVRSRRIPKQYMQRDSKKISKRVNIVYIVVILAFILYLVFWLSEIANDVISIFALGIALSDVYIVSAIVGAYKNRGR